MNWGTYLRHNDAGKEIPAPARALPPPHLPFTSGATRTAPGGNKNDPLSPGGHSLYEMCPRWDLKVI